MPYKGLYYYYYGICLALFSTHSLLVVSHEPCLYLNCPLMATLLEFCRDIRCVKTGVTATAKYRKKLCLAVSTQCTIVTRDRERQN